MQALSIRRLVAATAIALGIFAATAVLPSGAHAAAAANDNFANAEVLSGALPISTTGTTVDATREVSEPDHGDFGAGSSVWYGWTASSSGPVAIDLNGSDYDTYLAVYTGSSLASLSLVGENDDGDTGVASRLDFSASSGTTYRIAVDGFDGEVGSVALSIFEVGSISGTVTNSSASPLEDICVDAYDGSGEYAGFGDSDSSGNYTIGGLGSGSYRIEFYDCGSNNVVGEYYDDKADLGSADPIAVTAGADTPGIDAELAGDGSGDTTPPDTIVDSGAFGTITTAQATFSFHGDPAGDTAKIQCKFDAGSYSDCSSPKTYTGIPDGAHAVFFRAEDAAGNRDPTPAVQTFLLITARTPCVAAGDSVSSAKKKLKSAKRKVKKAKKSGNAAKVKKAKKRVKKAKRKVKKAQERQDEVCT